MKKILSKKVVIGIPIIVLLGVCVFLFWQKGPVIEKQIEQFVEQNLEKVYHIHSLENLPNIKEATFTLNEYSTDSARSVFRLIILEKGQQKKIEIPFLSTINRGSSQHNGTNFGFAHIVTRPDLSAFSELPEQVRENFFHLESFIGNDGSLRHLFIFKPLVLSNNVQMSFEGGQVQLDSSFRDLQKFVLNMEMKKLSVKENEDGIEIQPFSCSVQVKNGKYDGKTSDWESLISFTGNQTAVRLSEIFFNGEQKSIENCKTKIGLGLMQCKEIEIKNNKVHFRLENMETEGGILEKGKDSFTASGRFNCTPKLLFPSFFPADIQKVGIQYELSGITTEILNNLHELNETFAGGENEQNNMENAVGKLLQAVQKANVGLEYSIFVKEAKGDAIVKATASLNETAKKVGYQEMMQNGAEKFCDMQLDFSCNKDVANSLNLATIFQMQPHLFQLKDDVFTSHFTIKDGEVKINGNKFP